MAGGWFLTSAPIITANWEASSDDTWVVPLGGGGGRVFHIGPQPVNMSLQAYYNVEKPQFAPDWSLRFAISFLSRSEATAPLEGAGASCCGSPDPG
jgi:hypothetical protein